MNFLVAVAEMGGWAGGHAWVFACDFFLGVVMAQGSWVIAYSKVWALFPKHVKSFSCFCRWVKTPSSDVPPAVLTICIHTHVRSVPAEHIFLVGSAVRFNNAISSHVALYLKIHDRRTCVCLCS